MRYVLSSAVISAPGTYTYRQINQAGAEDWLHAGSFESCVGYPETILAFSLVFNRDIALSRKTIKMELGDEALVFRLTSRVVDLRQKGGVGLKTILENLEIGILKRER